MRCGWKISGKDDMQLYGMRTMYGGALKRVRSLGRGKALAGGSAQPTSAEFGGTSVSLSQALAQTREETAGQGLAAYFTPNGHSVRRNVAHLAGQSHADEARLSNQLRQLRAALYQINQLQHAAYGMGPA